MSENINGYLLQEPLKTDNSGFSKWGYGTKEDKDYFIKEFLKPVYPVDEKLLGAELTEKRKAVCRQYVEQKRKLFQALNQSSDGNLVRIEHFFRYGSRYYITMKKIEAVSLPEILRLPKAEKLRLCLILAHALGSMHAAGLVHGDVKPDNVIFCRNEKGIGVKIIDLDACFWESDPPKNDEDVLGDQIYMAPETFLLIAEEEGALTAKIDVFALGLLFHQFFIGMLPHYEAEEYHYPYEVLINRKKLTVSERMDSSTGELVQRMLERDPEDRPDMQEVCEELKQIYIEMTRPKMEIEREIKREIKSEHKNELNNERKKEETAEIVIETGEKQSYFFTAGEDDL